MTDKTPRRGRRRRVPIWIDAVEAVESHGPLAPPSDSPHQPPVGGVVGYSDSVLTPESESLTNNNTILPSPPCDFYEVHGYLFTEKDLIDYLRYTFSVMTAHALVYDYGYENVHYALDVVEKKTMEEGLRNPAGFLIWFLRTERQARQLEAKEQESHRAD